MQAWIVAEQEFLGQAAARRDEERLRRQPAAARCAEEKARIAAEARVPELEAQIEASAASTAPPINSSHIDPYLGQESFRQAVRLDVAKRVATNRTGCPNR